MNTEIFIGNNLLFQPIVKEYDAQAPITLKPNIEEQINQSTVKLYTHDSQIPIYDVSKIKTTNYNGNGFSNCNNNEFANVADKIAVKPMKNKIIIMEGQHEIDGYVFDHSSTRYLKSLIRYPNRGFN